MNHSYNLRLRRAFIARKTLGLQLGCDILDGHSIALPPAALLIFTLLFTPAIPAYAQPPVHLPTDPSVVHGTATFDTVGNQMTVTNSPNAILDWQDFSIGAGHEVHFQQLNAASQVLNRVTGNDPSQILGSLSSNGGVWLINPHGVLFGQNARIDVAGLVTSTLDISNIDFLAGKYNFLAGGGSPGQVTNQGEIKTTFGGRVWLIGEQVRNEGLIQTPGGNIVLAAGKSLELIDSGAPNVIVRVTAPDNEVANLGSLVAASGGNIDVYGSIVNQQGIVRADSVGTDAAGRIVFTASQALNLKENSVTSAQGGTIQMTADIATYLAGRVDVSQQQGAAGRIQLLTGQMQGTVGGSLRADGMQGGSISIEGRDTVTFSSLLSATGSSHGGTIGITGDRVYIFDAAVDASGGAQGGIVHIGGGWKGGGDLPHARNVFIGSGSEIKANGSLTNTNIPGQGGEIVVWSTQSSAHYGLLQAGNGGRIELSSQGEILQGGKFQAGPGGSVLLDPKNLIIADTPPDSLTLARTSVAQQSGEEYGFSVALNGDHLAIGAPAAGLNNSGAVYLWTGASSSGFSNPLALIGKLVGPNSAEQFGSAVAISGDLLAVGAPFANRVITDSPQLDQTHSGLVYLYNGEWNTNFLSQTATKIDEPTLVSGDQFGFAVALDQDRLAIGANGVASSQGAVYLYTGAGTTLVPHEQKKIQFDNSLSHTTSRAFFGRAVALDGDRLAVGAPKDMVGADGNGGNGIASGAVYLYTGVGTDFSGLSVSSPIRIISPAATKSANDDFGVAVALNGTRLAVGAAGEGKGGLVYLYTTASTSFSSLAQQATLSLDPNSSLTNGARFGYGVSLDGNRLAVGARDYNNSDGIVSLYSNVVGLDNATFGKIPSETSYISPSSITQLLNAGTAVVLQANNDITVQSPIIAEPEGSNGGALSFQAGRNINLNAGITTSNGNFIAVAGDSDANAAFREPGTPTLTINSGASLNVGTGTATLAAIDGRFVNNNGNSAIITNPDSGGRWLIYATEPGTSTPGFSASSYNQHFAQIYMPGSNPAYAANGNWFLYTSPDVVISPKDKQDTLDTSVQSINVAMLGAFPILDWSTTGFVVDLASMKVPDFGTLNLARMSRTEMQQLIDMRREFKEKLFADAIYKLNMDPSLANVPPCPSLADVNTGLCRITDAQRKEHASKAAREEFHKGRRKTKLASLPQIERKVVVLFGIDQYTDKTIPSLENAIFDAEVVGKLFADKLGYEVNVVKNATKADIVRTLNQLSTEMQPHDSVIIYYAGHGYRNEKTGGGYWIPADASVNDPTSWVSNSDVSKMLSDISAKQMVMISDSCYSGTFAEEKLGLNVAGIKPDEVLAKRSVIVMSSGGDEPVADEGREGHSIFAWDLMQALRGVDNWQSGTTVFEQVKREVMKSFPQTPQYGTVKSAGHEAGGEYLFEFRQLE